MVRAPLITLDTSGLYALLDRLQRDHQRVVEALRTSPGPYVVPVAILSEIAYLVESRLGDRVMHAFLADLVEGAFQLDCGMEDIPRVRELAIRYGDLPLGFSDASVIACAERNAGLVLTLDERHFRVVECEGNIRLAP